jgi:hypothetical protein
LYTKKLKILIVFTNIAKEKIVIFISSISLSGYSTLFPGLNTFQHRCGASYYPMLPLKQQRDNRCHPYHLMHLKQQRDNGVSGAEQG